MPEEKLETRSAVLESTGPDSLAVKIDGVIRWEIRRSGMYLDGKPVWVDTHGFLRLGDGEPEEPDDLDEENQPRWR